MNSFHFESTTQAVFGPGALDQLGAIVKELGAARALLVTDPGIVKAGYAERVAQILRTQGIEPVLFSNVDENPTSKHIQTGADFANEAGPLDVIIGLGGGSAMDTAKGINFLLTNGGRMEDYWGFNKATKPMLPSIGIPTTAGTGSEAQSYALISQETTHTKMACGDRKARFRAVILDPLLTRTCPQAVTAIAGMDAITHSVETFVTKTRNRFSQMYSREAWMLLSGNLEKVLSEPNNVEGRANMLLGAHFAGVAIEHSMLGAAHACANPLTARYGTAHGIAVSLMLPAVIRFNESEVGAEYRHLSADLYEEIVKLRGIASLPDCLRALEIERATLPHLAKEAATQWTGKHNPRPVSESEFLHLYEASW